MTDQRSVNGVDVSLRSFVLVYYIRSGVNVFSVFRRYFVSFVEVLLGVIDGSELIEL